MKTKAKRRRILTKEATQKTTGKRLPNGATPPSTTALRTARKAASAPLAKKHHVLAKAATPKTGNRELGTRNVLSSFNPLLPVDGSLIIAGELRNQFNGLVVMIQSIPAGPPGPQGPPFATAIIDGVTTLEPAEPAWVTSCFDGTDVHFSFGIPRGYEGVQGQQGIQGPPFAQAVVDSVTTLPPGYDATVTVSFDGTNVHFTFGIPQGDVGQQGQQGIQGEQGIQGQQGIQGEQGQQGIQGPPGEVTNASLAAAISGTSNNTNGVATLGLFVSDPPTQAEMQSLASKVDELILALRR